MGNIVDELRAFGADTDEGIKRCASKEELYIKLVRKVPGDPGFSELSSCIEKSDLDAAFEQAHRLKGSISNLSLNPLKDPIERITESLREKQARDYSADLAKLEEERARLQSIVETCE